MTRRNGSFAYSLHLVVLSVLIAAAGLCGCAKKGVSNSKAVIKIDGYSLTQDEFNELLADSQLPVDTKARRKAFVENLITRKTLLREAEKEGLDKNKEFLKAVERFWEQSLLNILIERKVEEMAGTVSVSDEEVRSFYDNWAAQNPAAAKPFDEVRDSVRAQVLRNKQTAELNSWIEDLRSNTRIWMDKKALGIE